MFTSFLDSDINEHLIIENGKSGADGDSSF